MPMILLLALIGCSEPARVEVRVLDVWSKPLAGATVVQDGVQERFTTGSNGKVMVPVEEGERHLMAGLDGYIKELATIEVPKDADDDDLPKVVLKLYPDPGSPGFYGVGSRDYIHLEATPINAVATEISTWHGLRVHPKASMSHTGDELRFVLHSTLRADELKRQDLKLSSLRFVEEGEVLTVLGAQNVDLDLWVADSDVPFEVKGLQSRDDYLILVKPIPAPGIYAFHAQNILDSRNAEALDKLPEELKVAFTFEIR